MMVLASLAHTNVAKNTGGACGRRNGALHRPLGKAARSPYHKPMDPNDPAAAVPPSPALAPIPTGEETAPAPYFSELTPLAEGYRTVLRVQLIFLWLPILIGAAVLLKAFDQLPFRGALIGALAGLALFTILFLPARRFQRWGYQLRKDRLRVVRGYWFHVDTIVPFVRVQHIDVSQGPVERLCNVATLTIHTAGTHNSVVHLPGLEPELAAAMRDAIRARIRSDAE